MKQLDNANHFAGAEKRVIPKVTSVPAPLAEQDENPQKVRFLYLKKRPGYYHVTAPDVTHAAVEDESRLRSIVEELSLQLHELVAEKGFTDQAVVELSQTLDIYIVQLQRLIRKKAAVSVQPK